MIGMSVRKLSVALDDAVARAAAASAKREGVSLSAWLDRAAREALAIEDGLRAVAEWEVRHGALTLEDLAAADVILASVVIGALARGDLVLTSDASDLERIAAALGRRLAIHSI